MPYHKILSIIFADRIVQIDATAEEFRPIVAKFRVQSYPTLILANTKDDTKGGLLYSGERYGFVSVYKLVYLLEPS